MAKEREARSERMNISLRPSTVAILERLAKAAGRPVVTVVSDYVEEGEAMLAMGAAALEKLNESRAAVRRRHGVPLLKNLKGAS